MKGPGNLYDEMNAGTLCDAHEEGSIAGGCTGKMAVAASPGLFLFGAVRDNFVRACAT